MERKRTNYKAGTRGLGLLALDLCWRVDYRILYLLRLLDFYLSWCGLSMENFKVALVLYRGGQRSAVLVRAQFNLLVSTLYILLFRGEKSGLT